jgi:hypothetical protein
MTLTRAQFMLTHRQHEFLRTESIRTGLAMSELVRRAIDGTYRPHARPRVRGYHVSLSLSREADAAAVGRPPLARTRFD